MQAQLIIKSSRAKELCAVALFLLVGGIFALPCLCVQGEISGRCKMALLLMACSRLTWCAYKRTFRFRDCFIYFALVVVFCLWADSQY